MILYLKGLAERIQKSLGRAGLGAAGVVGVVREEEEGKRVVGEAESVRDLVRNLTNLALAITEDRADKAKVEDMVEEVEEEEEEEEEEMEEEEEEEALEKRRLVVSTSEGGLEEPEGR